MRLLIVALLLSCSLAHADPVSLAIPGVSTYSPHCGAARVDQQTVTGFDGQYLTVQVQSYTVCGSSGRDATVSSIYWCDSVVLDLGGHLISDTPLIAAHTSVAYRACPHVNVAGELFTVGGYSAYTESMSYNYSTTVAVLDAP